MIESIDRSRQENITSNTNISREDIVSDDEHPPLQVINSMDSKKWYNGKPKNGFKVDAKLKLGRVSEDRN